MGAGCTAPRVDPTACECRFEEPPTKTRLRVGSLSGWFDAPLQRAISQGRVEDLTVSVHWVRCPSDADAAMSMLSAGLLDVALMHTEDAVAFAAAGSALRICGTFVETSPTWGLYMSAFRGGKILTFDQLGECSMVIPNGKRARMAAVMLCRRFGIVFGSQGRQLVANSLRQVCAGLRSGMVQIVIWDKQFAKPIVDRGEWVMLHEEVMPWPSLLLVATREALHAKSGAIQVFVDYAAAQCRHFEAMADIERARFVSSFYGLTPADASVALRDVTWTCAREVHEHAIAGPLSLMCALGILPENRCKDPMRLVARDICDFLPAVASTEALSAMWLDGLEPIKAPFDRCMPETVSDAFDLDDFVTATAAAAAMSGGSIAEDEALTAPSGEPDVSVRAVPDPPVEPMRAMPAG